MIADCPGTQPVRTLLSDQGALESVVTGPDRQLYFTSVPRRALVRLRAPGTPPEVVTDGIEAPGGLLPGVDGRSVVVGYGDSLAGGVVGTVIPSAGLLSVDLASGGKELLAGGTGMSNGLARDAAGAIYASTDAGVGIDRIVDGVTQVSWAQVASPNGLAIDRAGEWVYAAQTFVPAAVARVRRDDPSQVEEYVRAPVDQLAAGLDGMTIDAEDNLYVAANAAGEVWRVNAADRSICAVARGLTNPSAVAFGAGGAFGFRNLYAVGFDGKVVEIPDVRAAAPARLQVRPRRVRAGVRTRVTVSVRSAGDPVSGVAVRARDRGRGTTDAQGRVRFVVRPCVRRPIVIRAAGRTFRLRVRPAGPVPRPQGQTC